MTSDARIQDLRMENDFLRGEITSLRFDSDVLNRMLAEANVTGSGEVCACRGCFLAKRFSPVDPEKLVGRFLREGDSDADKQQACVVKQCLLWQCARLGLTCEQACVTEGLDGWDEIRAFRRDCHIVIVDKGCFWEVEYGRKFDQTGLHKNAQLRELMALFGLLDDDGGNFWLVDGTDYRAVAIQSCIK